MSRRLHRLLRRLLPTDFRALHGGAMEDVFVEALEVAGRIGARAVLRVWLRELVDLVQTGATLRRERRAYGSSFVARGKKAGRNRRREGRTMGLMDDLRYAIRSLVRRPSLTIFAALTVALGVGATTSIFSTLEAVILNPLPYDHGDRMITLMRKMGTANGFMSATAGQLDTWTGHTEVFERVERNGMRGATLYGAGDPREIRAGLIRPSFHDFVGRRPVVGRAFSEEELRGEGARVAVLGYSLWEEMFGRAPDALGRTINLDGEPWTIVGVMPKRTFLPVFGLEPIDVWLPLSDQAAKDDVFGMALLAEGVSLEAANERLATIPNPDTDGPGADWQGVARLIADDVGNGMRATLGLLMGAVVLLLLIACVNVSNLLLFRAGARRRETAVRAAVGGGRTRLARQHLVESLLLALLGGTIGIVLAYATQSLILRLRPESLSILDHVGINPVVLGFAIAITLVTGLLFGVIPAFQAGRPDTLESLRSGTRGEGDVIGARTRWALVAGELALSFALLVASLSVLRTLAEKQSSDLGYRADEVAVIQVDVPRWKYETWEEHASILGGLRDRIAALPGVARVSTSDGIPPKEGVRFGQVEPEGGELTKETLLLYGPSVSPGYFETLGQSIVEGRSFVESDVGAGEDVVVVGQETARRILGSGSAVGKRFRIGATGGWKRVIGVAADVPMNGLSAANRPLQLYSLQKEGRPGSMVLARVTAGVDPAGLLPLMREVAVSVSPDLRIDVLAVAGDMMKDTLERERFTTTVMGAFAVLALLLAAVGLYGVVSQVVGQRTREIGIRIALGARRSSIASTVMQRSIGATLLGIGVGVALAFGLSTVLESQVVGLEASTPLIYVQAGLALTLIAVVAAWTPAHRATRVDPVTAMRTD